MKILLLLLTVVPAFAQNLPHITTISGVSTNGVVTTNSVTIKIGEAARVVTVHPVLWTLGGEDGSPTIAAGMENYLVKNGGAFEVFKGDVIEGPATFVIVGGLLTLERWKLLPRVTTTTAVSTVGQPATNSVTIKSGEAARVVTLHPVHWSVVQPVGPTIAAEDPFITVAKGGGTFRVFKGDVIEGPATFTLIAYGGLHPTSLLTLERWRLIRR